MATKTLDEVKRDYERWYEPAPELSSSKPQQEAPWYQWARQSLQDVRGRTVLEIACGTGALVDWLAAEGARVVGCDISERALAVALARGRGLYSACDIHLLPFRDSEFDVVVCCETLEHTLDPDAALRELIRVAKPGAKMLVTTPNYLNTYGLYRIYLWLRGRPFGVAGVQPIDRVFFSPALLWRLRRHGLHIRATAGLLHYLRPARRRLEVIERSPWLRRWLKHFALHFTVEARVSPSK
jgi:SAM-dependent methyltransferase